MTAYVDALLPQPWTRQWPYGAACHLFADSVEELHVVAQSIGVKRAGFHDQEGDHPSPHYHLVASKRIQALERGAVEITALQTPLHISVGRVQ